MNIAINGFGRIGRAVFKALLEKESGLKVVAVNDLSDTASLAHLLQYDTCYGVYEKEVGSTAESLIVDGQKIPVIAEKDPAKLPWKEMKVDLVLECTGRFRTKEDAGLHLQAGAKKVLISAPARGAGVKTVVLGVNEAGLKKTDKVISNASCTTNCLAPATKVIKDNFGIAKAMMTTIHSYTADQNIVDGPHKDLRRARAAAQNIVPTTTGAAKAVCLTIRGLDGKFDGMAVRVPTPVASLTDVVFLTKKNTSAEEVNNAIKKAANSKEMRGILDYSEEPLVSSDYIGHPASGIVDLLSTKVVDGNLLKLIIWYDNEWGYSCRLADLAEYIFKKKLI